jgi:hypothetical protein
MSGVRALSLILDLKRIPLKPDDGKEQNGYIYTFGLERAPSCEAIVDLQRAVVALNVQAF